MNRAVELQKLLAFLLLVVSVAAQLTSAIDWKYSDGELELMMRWSELNADRPAMAYAFDMVMPVLLFISIASAFLFLWVTPYLFLLYLVLCIPWAGMNGIGIYMPWDGAIGAIQGLLLTVVFALSWRDPDVRQRQLSTAPAWAKGVDNGAPPPN